MGPLRSGCSCVQQHQERDHPLYRVMTKAKPLPPLEELNKRFVYDASTGIVTWKISPSKRVKAGQQAGTISKSGYLKISITINSKFCVFAAHRLIWYMMTGADPSDHQIDHVDNDPLNNKFSNLRLATNAQNNRNRGVTSRSKSGLKGAYWSAKHKKWRSAISLNKREIYLGWFAAPELAHAAYCKAALELHGEFARTS